MENTQAASTLARDKRDSLIQAFVLTTAIVSGTSYTPARDTLVSLGAEVDITVNGVAVPFLKGDKIILSMGTTYGFSESIALGVS